MFEYRRNLRGDAVVPVKDYRIDNAYAADAKVGDIVKLNESGQVVAATEGDAPVLGVFLGPLVKREKDPDFYGKVQTAEGMIFEATYTGDAPTVGGEHPITVADGEYHVDLTSTANPAVKIVAVNEKRQTVDVVFTALQLG